MQINRGLVFWGVALVTAGAVALAIQSGVIAGDSARELWRFWPIILILIGLAIIAARTPFALIATLVAGLALGSLAGTLVSGFPEGFGCGGDVDRTASDAGSFGDTASVELEFNCGDLAVSTGSGSDWSVDAGYAGDNEPSIEATEGSLRVVADDDGFFLLSDHRQDWSVVLPTDTELELNVDANASSSDLDLDGATLSVLQVDANAGEIDVSLPGASVGDLSVDANAGSISIEADGSTTLDGSIEINAGALDLCVPEGTGVAITIEDANITFSHNLDEVGLTRQGDTWRSGDGTAAITLNVDGNAASFTLNPDGGCS